MEIYLPEKYASLPGWLIEMAKHHGVSHTEDVMGIDAKKNPKKYINSVANQMTLFLDEAITESLTPHIGRNPTTPKDETSYFAFSKNYFEGSNSFLEKNISNTQKREKVSRIIRSAVNTLASIYLDNAMKVELHQKKFLGNTEPEQFSDMEFKPGIGKSKEEKLDETKKAYIARYYRAFIVSSILSLLKPLFSTNGEEIKSMVDDELKKYQIADLRDKGFRLAFSTKVKDTIEKSGFNLDKIRIAFKN